MDKLIVKVGCAFALATSADGLQAVAYNQAAMRKNPFTAKQGQYLAFIFYYTKIHGFAPAESDMQKYFGV